MDSRSANILLASWGFAFLQQLAGGTPALLGLRGSFSHARFTAVLPFAPAAKIYPAFG